MTEMNLVQAINSALRGALREDENVLLMGEDIGTLGGVFRVTQGLREEFGPDRVLDTPLSETGILGTAIGMALHGLRPVSEIQFADFIYPGFDQLVSEAAKYRYRTAGEFHVPMVVRTPYGGGIRGGQYHSQSPEALFIHTPGLKVVCPSNPYDAKGLLLEAIEDDDPVIFFEPKRVYRAVKMDVPDTTYRVPLGEGKVVRAGEQVTCLAWGAMLYEAFSAAEEVAKEGVDVEVIDLRTLWPLDIETITSSVKKTGRLVIVHEAPRTCGFGGELVALITERAFLHLEAPPVRVTGWDTPFPLTHEREYLPLVHRIAPVLLETARY
ncbi:MAG: alpha-ketoacid dehydrogenase subunit beta [Myxococcales bacterium]|nr:alpha-ketoacid dehydrogenase subunit beta [Myxococcales bacterium]